MDWNSPQRSEDAIVSTLQSWRAARNGIGTSDYKHVLRRVYLNEAFISRDAHPGAYILLAPLAPLLPSNYSSAVRATEANAAACWQSEVLSGRARELEARVRHLLGAPHAAEALEEHEALWRRDRETPEYARVLTEARRRTGVTDLESSFDRLDKRSPDLAHLLFSSVHAGLVAGGANGRSPLLDVALSVLHQLK